MPSLESLTTPAETALWISATHVPKWWSVSDVLWSSAQKSVQTASLVKRLMLAKHALVQSAKPADQV